MTWLKWVITIIKQTPKWYTESKVNSSAVLGFATNNSKNLQQQHKSETFETKRLSLISYITFRQQKVTQKEMKWKRS